VVIVGRNGGWHYEALLIFVASLRETSPADFKRPL